MDCNDETKVLRRVSPQSSLSAMPDRPDRTATPTAGKQVAELGEYKLLETYPSAGATGSILGRNRNW